MHGSFGADISKRTYLLLCAASAVGSILEWYDYTVFAALAPILSKVFFPANKPPVLAQLSFWSVYAVGFICRPLGSLVFGHLTDVCGRRLSLLVTIVLMGLPTLIIGCLPDFNTAGVAAPVALSILRLVQGLAVGGELGTAAVYMYELAPSRARSKGSSIIFVSVTAGILLGIVVTMILTASTTTEQLLAWGWRIPFLLSVFTFGAGVMLRWHAAPEPSEFLNSTVRRQQQHPQQQQQQQQLLHSRHADSTARVQAAMKNASCSINSQTCSSQTGQQIGDANVINILELSQVKAAAAAYQGPSIHYSALDTITHDEGSKTDQQIHSCSDSDADARGESVCSKNDTTSGISKAGSSCKPSTNTSIKPLSRWQLLLGHHPVKLLFKHHWKEVLLLFCFEAWPAANFYVFYGWLPAFLNTKLQIRLELTLAMTLVNMSLTLPIIPALAHASDKGLPRCAATAALLALAAAAGIPMFMAISSTAFAAAWAMQLVDLMINACIFGLLPTIGSSLFPVHVRATGFNFCHTAGQSWLGGLSPLAVTALQVATGNVYLVTGMYVALCAMISLIAVLGLWRWYPQTNRNIQTAAGACHDDSLLLVTANDGSSTHGIKLSNNFGRANT